MGVDEITVLPRPAVFLDRDGVINRPVIRGGKPFPPQTVDEFAIIKGVSEACILLKEAGFLIVVTTNQPDVGRGTLAIQNVEAIHEFMRREIPPIDEVKVCYDSGAAPSPNRKPQPGMLLRAAQDLNIDLKLSFMVGDRWRDIDCGHAAGCQTIFIDWGYDEALRQPPTWRAKNLLEAARLILTNP